MLHRGGPQTFSSTILGTLQKLRHSRETWPVKHSGTPASTALFLEAVGNLKVHRN